MMRSLGWLSPNVTDVLIKREFGHRKGHSWRVDYVQKDRTSCEGRDQTEESTLQGLPKIASKPPGERPGWSLPHSPQKEALPVLLTHPVCCSSLQQP